MLVLGIQGEPNAPRRDPRDVIGELRPAGWYHDAAAVLLEDGRLVAAIEEERLSRRKHTGRFPTKAIQFCLQHRGILLEDVDRIAFGECGGEGPYRNVEVSRERIAEILRAEFHCGPDIAERVQLVEHHVGHAVSAYACSGYRDALVVTIDAFGDGIAGSVMSARNGVLEVLDWIEVANSLGRFYGAPLGFLGFDAFSEYKVMGLAPYGNPARFRDTFRSTYELLPEGRFELKIKQRKEILAFFDRLGPRRDPDGPFEAVHRDLAAAMQEALETILRHVFVHFQRTTGHRFLCLAGGTAQNCSANGKVLAEGIFDDLFVQPAAADSGIAIGAALHAWSCASGSLKAIRQMERQLEHMYLGGELEQPARLEQALAQWSDFVDFRPVEDVCEVTARLLADGLVVGWVQGRSEFGPRALGNRSILADPRPAGNKARINEMVKKREGFRPFAPSVLEERAAEYFDLPGPAGKAFPFMTFVVPVRAEKRDLLGAVTHVDGTARVQTVSRRINELYWRLIRCFGELTGVPVLLNTSFNSSAEPIVESAYDALVCFLTTGLDRLVLGGYVVSKKGTDEERRLRCLDLIATLPIDAVLAQGLERRQRVEPAFEREDVLFSIHTLRRWSHLSTAAFQAIAAGHRGDTAGTALDPSAQPVERAKLADELYELWAARFVAMLPSVRSE